MSVCHWWVRALSWVNYLNINLILLYFNQQKATQKDQCYAWIIVGTHEYVSSENNALYCTSEWASWSLPLQLLNLMIPEAVLCYLYVHPSHSHSVTHRVVYLLFALQRTCFIPGCGGSGVILFFWSSGKLAGIGRAFHTFGKPFLDRWYMQNVGYL